ncbi:synchronized import protein 1 [Diutina catenulata]
MGKTKKTRKNTRARVNPLTGHRAAVGAGIAAATSAASSSSEVAPLIARLKSADPKEKAMAIGTLGVLCENGPMRQVLLKEKLVQTVMEYCLHDASREVETEAFGLLRNLAIDEGYDVIKFMWRQNVWASVETALAGAAAGFGPEWERRSGPERELAYDFCENVLSLVVVMATSDEVIFESVFAKIDPLVRFVLEVLAAPVSERLVHAALDFLYEFSTESDQFVELLRLQAGEGSLNFDALDQRGDRLTAVYLDGIRFNTMENADHTACGEVLLSLYTTCSTIDLAEVVRTLNDTAPLQSGGGSGGSGSGSGAVSGAGSGSGSGAGAGAGADTGAATDTSSDGGAAAAKRATQAAAAARADLRALEVSLDLVTAVLEVLSISHFQRPVVLSDDIVAHVLLGKVLPFLVEVVKFEIAHQGRLLVLNRALVALNNFCWLMLANDKVPTAWFELSTGVWDLMQQVVASAGAGTSGAGASGASGAGAGAASLAALPTASVELQKTVLSILWGIAKAIGPTVQQKVQMSMIQQLVAQVKGLSKSDDESLELYLAIMGFLGAVAPLVSDTSVVSEVGGFLMATVDATVDVVDPMHTEVAIEALNLVYDVFGDKSYPWDAPVFVEQGYLARLREFEPRVKVMFKKVDKNKHHQLKAKAEETWQNLGRFIQYKESE